METDEKTRILFPELSKTVHEADMIVSILATAPGSLQLVRVLKNRHGPAGGLLFTVPDLEEEELRDGENNR